MSIDPRGIVDPIVAFRKSLEECRARLHEVEAERVALVDVLRMAEASQSRLFPDSYVPVSPTRDAIRSALAGHAAALANAITPQQRAVLEAAVAWHKHAPIQVGVPEVRTLYEAVDALLESGR